MITSWTKILFLYFTDHTCHLCIRLGGPCQVGKTDNCHSHNVLYEHPLTGLYGWANLYLSTTSAVATGEVSRWPSLHDRRWN